MAVKPTLSEMAKRAPRGSRWERLTVVRSYPQKEGRFCRKVTANPMRAA